MDWKRENHTIAETLEHIFSLNPTLCSVSQYMFFFPNKPCFILVQKSRFPLCPSETPEETTLHTAQQAELRCVFYCCWRMGSENPEFCQETEHAQKETKETRVAPSQWTPPFPELALPRLSTEILPGILGTKEKAHPAAESKTKIGAAVSAWGIQFTQVRTTTSNCTILKWVAADPSLAVEIKLFPLFLEQ